MSRLGVGEKRRGGHKKSNAFIKILRSFAAKEPEEDDE